MMYCSMHVDLQFIERLPLLLCKTEEAGSNLTGSKVLVEHYLINYFGSQDSPLLSKINVSNIII